MFKGRFYESNNIKYNNVYNNILYYQKFNYKNIFQENNERNKDIKLVEKINFAPY